MSESRGYVSPEYLKAAAALLQPIKQRTYERMQIRPGHAVLDVGCGAGADTIPLARAVGEHGRAVGVDRDIAMLRGASAQALAEDVGGVAFHLQAEAEHLPLPADTFDACRSERLFQHLPHPQAVLDEMIRVTKTGGRVVVLDADHGTWSVDTDERDIERRLTRFKADTFGCNGYAGRQLYRLFSQAGLHDITCEIVSGYFTDYALVRFMFILDEIEPAAVKAGVITIEELSRWRSSLERSARDGTFFCSESMVLVSGRKV